MNDELIETLQGLRRDPTLAIILYEQLFTGHFWALVSDSSVPVPSLMFLTYPTRDGIRELPVFTAPDRKLANQIVSDPAAPVPIPLPGETLWHRMLDIVRTGDTEVAVDPGEEHSIRLNREMILGMVSKYGTDNGRE